MGTPKLHCCFELDLCHSRTVERHSCEFVNDVGSFNTISAGEAIQLFPKLVGRNPVIIYALFDRGNGRCEPLKIFRRPDIAVKLAGRDFQVAGSGEDVASADGQCAANRLFRDVASAECF